MAKTTIAYRALIAVFLFMTGCAEKDTLGNGFYVTYIDLPQLRGIYYDHQKVNEISIRGVNYNDSLILYYGYYFIGGTNDPDTSKMCYFLIRKQEYLNDPSQEKSKGQIGPLKDAEIQKYRSLLQNSKRIAW